MKPGRPIAVSLHIVLAVFAAAAPSPASAQTRAPRSDAAEHERHAPPSLWRLRERLAPPRVEYRADEPFVDPVAEANGFPETNDDLNPTIDVQITQEIVDKATELGTPEAMYEFVRNECDFEPYYGSHKGSVETLRQRSGNDHDLASLLIALYRASGIPARYAVGTVELPVDRVTSWLGVEDGIVAGSILFTYGMEGTAIVSGPDVVAVRCRRVWVEAFVPRGRGSASWVPLDPAMKLRSVQEGLDIPEEMALDAQAFVEDYFDPVGGGVALPRSETIIEKLEADLAAYLASAHPGLTVDDVRRVTERVAETLGVLPASLPYLVRSRDTQWSALPADRRYRVRFHLHDGGSTLVDSTFDLPAIAGKRITIDYVGATPADQAIIDANGGIYFTAPSTVDLKPVLRVDGADQATGLFGVGMGLSHESDIHFLEPVNAFGLPQNVVPAIFNTIVCGASQAIGIAIEGVAENLLTPPPADDTEGLAPLLWDTAMDYLARVRNDDVRLASLMHGRVSTGVANAIVENVVEVLFSGGVPQTFTWRGLRVDADRSVIGYWPVDRLDASDEEPRDFLVIGGAEGSLFENRVYEDNFGQDSVSTMKLLQLAVDGGITVYKRWDSLPLPANTLPAGVRQSIEFAILSGRVATFPASQIVAGDPVTGEWTGVGWIEMDPTNGAAGYLISGGHNGGATVETWPPEYIDLSQDDKDVTKVEIHIKGGDSPTGDSPHADSVYTRDAEQTLVFEYKVHVTYDDGSTRIMPDGGGYFRRETRNTTRSFFPGNYTFKVWISRRVWWIFSSTIAEAQRKVSIVAVLVREDDGSELGKSPPKLLRAKPPMGTTPMKKLKALVIPDKAPDGTALASAFAWTGGPRLTFKTPATQLTDLEPTDAMTSAAKDDQEVNVLVTLPGGKTQKGYAKIVLAKGGMDEIHKMTVFNVELEKCLNTFQPRGGTADNEVTITCRALPAGLDGQFEFKLEDVSEEPGFACNAPESLPFLPWSEDGTSFKDFQFVDQAGFDIDGIFWNHTATTDAEDIDVAMVRIKAYDYGAYAKLKATYKIDGETIEATEQMTGKAHTNLPLDDDDNHIWDGWADNAGNAVDDTDNNPALGMTMGDGLSRYEEWRGFMVQNAHRRTDPDNKDLFIWDASGIGLGNFGALGLTTHLIREAEFNGSGNREVNFRHDSHHVVLQHGLWLRDTNLGGMGSWGDAEAVGSPGDPGRVHVNVDLAQVAADMTTPPPAGFRPVGGANRVAAANAQLIAHELGHAVAIFHHQGATGGYAGNHSGDTTCVMRYYFIDMNNANLLAPPADVAAFNTFPIGNSFCNAAPDNCRSDVDVSDQ